MEGNIKLLALGLGILAIVSLINGFSTVTVGLANEKGERADGYLHPPASPPSFFMDKLVSKGVGLASVIVLIGTYAKLVLVPGGDFLLIIGTLTILWQLVLLALSRRLNVRTVVMTVTGVVMLALPSDELARLFHRDDPVAVEKFINRLHHPHDTTANNDLDRYYARRRAKK